MAETIKSGNSGYVAKVDANQRLHVDATTRPADGVAAEQGDAYNFNSGKQTLTTANESAVIYMKNNEDKDFNVTAIIVAFGASTAGTGVGYYEVIRNPTTGTIVSDATALTFNSNFNHASSKVAGVDVFSGTEGKTMTDGDSYILVQVAQSQRVFAAFNINMPKGTSIGVNITPLASNTSMVVYCALVGHLVDPANG